MTATNLSPAKATYEVADFWEWMELCYARGWTDGLPLCPPTEDRVQEVIDYLQMEPDEVVGAIPPKRGIATVRKIAANCVMAGAKPEYAPVVIAAVEAMLSPEFNLNGVQCTTHPCEPLTIVSGPIVKQLGLATQETVFAGGGNRANITIARAIRLILWNVGGGKPGEPVKESLGHPGRIAFLIAEDLEHSPWEPIHVDYGFDAGASTVTVIGADAPQNVSGINLVGQPPPVYLNVVSELMSSEGSNNTGAGGEIGLVLCARVANAFAEAGWSRDDVKRYVYEHARRRVGDLKRSLEVSERRSGGEGLGRGMLPKWINATDDDAWIPSIWSPENLLVAVSGSYHGHRAAVLPGWLLGGVACTRNVVNPQAPEGDKKELRAQRNTPRLRYADL